MKSLIKTNKRNTLRKLLTTALSIFFIFPVMAQREKREISLLDKDQIRRITDIVKPVKEQIEKQLNEDETYQTYLQDIKELNSTKNFEEKSSLTAKINEKYSDYFKKIWSEANVDEKSYQLSIRRVFPDNLAELIQFEAFLNFTLSVSTVTNTPPSEPPPPDKCLDICSMAAGEITGSSALVAAGGGSYGNCFLRTNAWGTGAFYAGFSELYGALKNNITIPGTLPDDSRKLRVIKSYELKQEATSFAALGGGFAETRARTYQTSEYMLVYSPVIWGSHAIKIKTMSENYLLEKKDVARSIFKTYANTVSAFISGNWCFSECSSIKWSICEEK